MDKNVLFCIFHLSHLIKMERKLDVCSPRGWILEETRLSLKKRERRRRRTSYGSRMNWSLSITFYFECNIIISKPIYDHPVEKCSHVNYEVFQTNGIIQIIKWKLWKLFLNLTYRLAYLYSNWAPSEY